MSLRTRTLVFATFFGNCLIIGLLIASMITEHWVHAFAKRPNSTESTGFVNLGLFSGAKELDVGYGPRSNDLKVPALIKAEPNIMNYWLWIGAALGTGFALFSSSLGAIGSVLKAASSKKNHGLMVLLFVANISSAISQILAFLCWLVQFFVYLTHNVLLAEDRKMHWYSRGLASLGFSFYFLVVSTIIVLANIIILMVAYRHDYRRRRILEPSSDEKNQGAIMLY